MLDRIKYIAYINMEENSKNENSKYIAYNSRGLIGLNFEWKSYTSISSQEQHINMQEK